PRGRRRERPRVPAPRLSRRKARRSRGRLLRGSRWRSRSRPAVARSLGLPLLVERAETERLAPRQRRADVDLEPLRQLLQRVEDEQPVALLARSQDDLAVDDGVSDPLDL